MAPSPEYDKEPKAPDKTTTIIPCEDTKVQHNSVSDQQTNSDNKTSTTSANTETENNKDVETLDDGQLRALLDEAITYKCPKDREGKSSLFKELLEEVEQDEQACEAAARSLGGCRGSKRGGRSRHALPHSNSLQNLVAALAAEPTRRHHARHAAPAPTPSSSVSARAIHGGSLPSGVDTSSLLSEEPARGAGYLATVRCVNPPPLAERRVSASDANAPHEMELLNRRSKPMFPMTYTARATLEIGSGSVSSGRAVTTTTASNQVDSAIPFSCITTPEVVASCNTTSSSASHSAVAVDPKPLQLGSCYRAVASLTGELDESAGRCAPALAPAAAPALALAPAAVLPTAPPATASATAPAPDVSPSEQPRSVISSSFNGLPLSRPNYGSTGTTAPDDYKKSLDENGNAVQGFSSPLSGSGQHKKPRRKKSSKNETVIDCRQIDGYQGDKDVNELLRFIESNAESARGSKLPRTKHRDDAEDKAGKKRSSERRKDKDKVKRASSLEELSRTTLEELTGPQPEPAPAKPERRSWGDTRDAPAHGTAPTPPAPPAPPAPTAPPAPPVPPVPLVPQPVALVTDPPETVTELTEFQTVTKKRKQRRRTDEPAPRRSRVPSPPSPPSPRAAHASDRSNDSNDDLDSVHSLPPAPSSSVPHASYADIARTRHNIPDLIESCNFYAEGEGEPEGEGETPRAAEQQPPPPPPPPTDSDGYPALESRVPPGAKRARDLGKHTATNVRRDRKDRPPQAETRAVECPAPDVVADRRPPVILLDSTARPRDMDGVTFGFDINEQLLGGSGRRPRCDLVCDALAVRAGCAPLRYLAPDSPVDTRHLHQIIEYVGSAWEDVIRCGSGKVRYFSE